MRYSLIILKQAKTRDFYICVTLTYNISNLSNAQYLELSFPNDYVRNWQISQENGVFSLFMPYSWVIN